MKINMLLILVISLVLTGCSDASDHQASGLAKPYQEDFAVAWAQASQGESPVMTCLQVGGTAARMVAEGKDKNNEARQAFEACYVDAFVHYTNVLFAQDDNADTESISFINACIDFRRNLRAVLFTMGSEYAEKLDMDLEGLNNKIREGIVEAVTLCPGYDNYFD